MSEKVYLYRYSWQEAKRQGQEQDWRLSYSENCSCAREIEQTINDNFDGKHFNSECVQPIIDKYGFTRVLWVLAATLKEQKHDGRFSQENKDWSNIFYIPEEKARREYQVKSHPAVVEGFINRVRDEWNQLNLFEAKHCVERSRADANFEGKVLIIDPYVLAEKYRTPEDQLFLASGGFGCNPASLGRKVMGNYLNDGTKGTHVRQDFLGVIKEECLPDWAREKLNELCSPKEEQSSGMSMEQN